MIAMDADVLPPDMLFTVVISSLFVLVLIRTRPVSSSCCPCHRLSPHRHTSDTTPTSQPHEIGSTGVAITA